MEYLIGEMSILQPVWVFLPITGNSRAFNMIPRLKNSKFTFKRHSTRHSVLALVC